MELKVNDEFAKMMANNAASLSISHRHLGIYNHVFALLDDRDTMLAEIKRLEGRLRFRSERVSTHWDDCYKDHYHCAMEKIERLREEIVLLTGDLGRMSIDNDGLNYQHKDDNAEIARLRAENLQLANDYNRRCLELDAANDVARDLRAEVEKIEKAEVVYLCSLCYIQYSSANNGEECIHNVEREEKGFVRPFALVPVEDK